jgi:hypothetical protein
MVRVCSDPECQNPFGIQLKKFSLESCDLSVMDRRMWSGEAQKVGIIGVMPAFFYAISCGLELKSSTWGVLVF